MDGLGAIRRVATNRRLVFAELAFAAYAIVLHAAWVGLVLYAYRQGGVGEAGLVSFGVLVPASLLGPFIAAWFSRLQPKWSLSGGLCVQVITIGLAGFAVGADLPARLVYVSVGVFAIAQMTTRPVIAANLPRIVDDPAELAAANSVTEVIETLGLIAGPALAGAVLLTSDEQGLFFVSALVLAGGAMAGIGIGTVGDVTEDRPRAAITSEVRGGAREIRTRAPVRHLVVLLLAIKLIIGVLEVALVPVALDQLSRSEATVGLLGAALGFGGIAGAGLSFLLVGRQRLTPATAVGVLIASVPLIAMAASGSLMLTVALLAIAGVGRPIVAVGGRTLLQSLSSEDTLAQLFGFLEGISMLAVAFGSVIFALSAAAFGLEAALVISGAIPVLLLARVLRPLVRLDRNRHTPDPGLLALMRRIPIFAPLSAFRMEQLLVNMEPFHIDADESVFAKGDVGDLLYVIADGSAVVELSEDEVVLGRGQFFGEIALIHDEPRMADVRSGPTGVGGYVLRRDAFIAALSSVPSSTRRAQRIVDDRLALSLG